MNDLVKALRSGEQADMDGTLVKVSRQACEEAADAIDALQAEIARLREALTPSAETKAAYWSEVECDCPTETWRHYVPWTSIKQIMKMIRARAALKGDSDE